MLVAGVDPCFLHSLVPLPNAYAGIVPKFPSPYIMLQTTRNISRHHAGAFAVQYLSAQADDHVQGGSF